MVDANANLDQKKIPGGREKKGEVILDENSKLNLTILHKGPVMIRDGKREARHRVNWKISQEKASKLRKKGESG
jgi:hypothetical protein